MKVLKKLWENKMTRMYLLAAGGLILLLLLIVIVSSSAGSKTVNEKTLTNAAESYIYDNPALAPKNNYDSRTISLLTLVSEGYVNEKKEGSSCSSYVIVTKVDGKYYYSPYIKCNNENDTPLFRNVLLKSVVTEGPGLYNYNDEYIYRGEVKNNYVNINNTLWRIIGFDENNNIKLINNTSVDYIAWDDRYNSVLDSQDGINDYSLSRIKDFLNDYENVIVEGKEKLFNENVKSRLVRFNQCAESINLESNMSSTCDKYVENQLIGIIRVQDYINASLDDSCSYANTKTCQNYNFLNNSSWTVSAYSGNNYEVYFIDKTTGAILKSAFYTNAVYPVITLRSDVIYVSGSGTEADPYNIK